MAAVPVAEAQQAPMQLVPTPAPAAGIAPPPDRPPPMLDLPPLNDATQVPPAGVPATPTVPPATVPPATLSIQPLPGSAAVGAPPLPPRRPVTAISPDLTLPEPARANLDSTPNLGLQPRANRREEMTALIGRLDNQLRYAQSGAIVAVAGFPVEVMIGRAVLQPNRSVCREVTVVTPPVDSAWACQRADGSWYHAQAR